MTILEAIKQYQVFGAMGDFVPGESKLEHGWADHVSGTFLSGIGGVLLGMPKGFNRIGSSNGMQRSVWIYETWEEKETHWRYGKFNVPCWKHLDEYGNTLVRGLSPRTNMPFLHVILGDHRDKIDCLEITAADIAEMD